ncbi:hypothetical protein [Brucella grignonensis]|uniref:Uncharacterized protein n=1 Tax=Brucella grignonensis TaxID=94627 RepID=A0A256F2Y8_9HYPH|nr:hypothetical protein [Brucella grignonensis]OYR09202.1 hypothetical protein CEV33_2931 [Brucella grignonensis]
MVEVVQFPDHLENHARILAAKLHGQRQAFQHREIRVEAGRLGESVIAAGGERWQGVRVEDHFRALVLRRLAELSGLNRAHPAPLLAFAVGGRP